MPETKQYNYCLDFIKGIACICVVFMHCEFPGLLGTAVQAVSRFSVPLFFMVSGFFCCFVVSSSAEINQRMIKKIKHVGKITLYACLAYSLFDIVQYFGFGKNFFSWNAKSVFDMIVFNQPIIVAGQYWFLFALLYDYLLFAMILKFKMTRYVGFFVVLAIVMYLVGAQGMHLLGHHIPNMFYRNFLIEGVAFFGLGYWVHSNQLKLKFSNIVLISIVIISSLLCLVERYLMRRDFGVNIVTFPQVLCLFLYAVNNPNKHAGVLQTIGKRYSMFVYIIHPIVWYTMEYVYGTYGIASNIIALYILPLIVVSTTLLVSHIIYYAKNSTHIPIHG